MKKLILTLLTIFFIAPICAASDNYIAYASKAAAKSEAKQLQTADKEIRTTFKNLLNCINNYDLEGIKTVYSTKYLNSDGFDREMYFDLIGKTWGLYPDIKYHIDIDNINIVGNTAIVSVTESAKATTTEKVDEIEIKGYLKSTSDCLYYVEKFGENWLITSDSVISEETTLTYGEANDIKMQLIVPGIVPANTEYTASLFVQVPDKKMLTIGSIGQEKITYPHVNADEVFRKLPESGILERVFKANKDNLNEYTVASVGITRARMTPKKEIKLVVTGLGYIITRTNVIPVKDFSKVKQQNGTKKTTAKLVD